MAQKRKVEVESKAPEAEPPPEDLGWRDWLLKKYARSWYWLACLFLDVFIFLEMRRVLHTNALVAAMAAVAVAVLQFAIYFRIWGRGGLLADDSDGDD
ncbi:MAG: hypothetical protein ISF22_07405 [Methanomassiliicoccus sp.]|nr:hypothetical protein [Methanomassiliicoccus sp.]